MIVNKPLETPVLFLVFNRPDVTQRVFDEIRKAKPSKLFLAADGPRQDKPGEKDKCQAVRNIVEQIDWDCEVYRSFRETNLGLKLAVSSAIDWFFEHADEGIILEDDCLPSQSFFWFCQELLERYRDDERIMQIGGNNYLFGKKKFDATYYFSKFNEIWGWATWKRAWYHYDVHMKTFPQFREEGQIDNYFDDREIQDWLMSYFEQDYNTKGRIGLWSSQWSYAICAQNGLTISPSVNLVQNIGLVGEATHIDKTYKLYGDAGLYDIQEIVHPVFVLPDREADDLRFEIIRKTDPRLVYATRLRVKALARQVLPKKSHNFIRHILNTLGSRTR